MTKGRPTSWVYTLRKTQKGAMLAVPAVVADQVPDGAQFALSVTADGLSYTYLGAAAALPEQNVDLAWINKEAS